MPQAEVASRSFPPLDRAIVVSIACDVVSRTGNPLSRQSTTDLAKRAQDELNKPISRTTVWEGGVAPFGRNQAAFSSARAANASEVVRGTMGRWFRYSR